MDTPKTHVALCWDEPGEGAKWGLFFDGDAEPFAYLTEAPEARVLPWLKEANAAPALAEALRELYEHGDEVELDSSETFQGMSDKANTARDKARTLLNNLKA